MSKNIIFCSDGTWNHPQEQKTDGGKQKLNTNVAKLADQAGQPRQDRHRIRQRRAKKANGMDRDRQADDPIAAETRRRPRIIQSAKNGAKAEETEHSAEIVGLQHFDRENAEDDRSDDEKNAPAHQQGAELRVGAGKHETARQHLARR